MIYNDNLDLVVAEQLNKWQEKVRGFVQNNQNKELNEILKKINGKCENVDKFLTDTADCLSLLKNQLDYDINSIKVVNFISEALPLSINYDTSNRLLALIGYNIIKQNPELSVATMVLDVFVENLTICFQLKIEKISHDVSKKSLILYTRLIGELLKLFSKQLIGNYHIVKLIAYEKELESEGTILDSIELIITTNIDEAFYFEQLFSSKNEVPCDVLLKLIRRVLQNPSSLNSAMSPSIESNICFKSLMAVSRHLSDVSLISELFNSSIQLITSPELSNQNFKFIESRLVSSFLSRDDYLLGAVCLEVFCQFLKCMPVTLYTSFFQSAFNHTNDLLQKQRISYILKCVGAQQLAPTTVYSFNETFQYFKEDANRENYQKLSDSLKYVKVNDRMQMKNFSEIIDALDLQNWNSHLSLAAEIFQCIKNIERIDTKMIYLLKIESAFDADFSFDLKKNLVEILISCLPHLDKSKGLSSLIEKNLEKILNENYALRRVWRNLSRENNSKYKINEEELTVPVNSSEILKNTVDLATSFTKINHREENLKKILNYGKWLLHQPNSRDDHKIILEIVKAFKNVLKEEKENL